MEQLGAGPPPTRGGPGAFPQPLKSGLLRKRGGNGGGCPGDRRRGSRVRPPGATGAEGLRATSSPQLRSSPTTLGSDELQIPVRIQVSPDRRRPRVRVVTRTVAQAGSPPRPPQVYTQTSSPCSASKHPPSPLQASTEKLRRLPRPRGHAPRPLPLDDTRQTGISRVAGITGSGETVIKNVRPRPAPSTTTHPVGLHGRPTTSPCSASL